MKNAKTYKLECIRECLNLLSKEDADLQGFFHSCICSLKEILDNVNSNNTHMPIVPNNATFEDNSLIKNQKNSLDDSLTDNNLKDNIIPDETINSGCISMNPYIDQIMETNANKDETKEIEIYCSSNINGVKNM